MEPIDPQLKDALDRLGLQPTQDAWEQLIVQGLSRYQAGQLEAAMSLFWFASRLAEHLHGSDHSDTLTAMGNLAVTLRVRGDPSGAETLQRRVLEARERTLPPDDRDTLRAMGNLALTLVDRGDLPGAEVLQRHVLAAYERTLPRHDRDTLRAMGNLAGTLHALGELSGAEDLQRHVLEACERSLPSDDELRLNAMGNLAETLHDRGELSGAEALQRRVLDEYERTLPPDHSDTLWAMGNLAGTLHALGDLSDSEALQRRVLEACERTLPPDHPDTLTAMGNLAVTLRARGDLSGAEELMARLVSCANRLRSLPAGVIGRAMMAEALSLTTSALRLATLRTRLGRPATLVLGAIEAGSSRSVLDLLQSNATDKRAAAAERVRTAGWTEEASRHYLADLERAPELEMQDKLLLDQQVPLDDQRRQAIAKELSEVRQRLIEAERQLLPAAEPWELAEIRKQLREGEVLLVYGWSPRWATLGVSLVALPHEKMGEEASAHWVSRVKDAPTPPETAELERALIHRMKSVALLIATGLAPEAARAADVARSLDAIQADADLLKRLDKDAMNDVERLAANLRKAADALTQDPPQKHHVPSMPIGSLGALAHVLLDFALPKAIRPVLHRASRVIVAPSGPLHDLPLDVLVELANFAPLKNKPVTLVPSGSILALIRSRGGDLHRDGVTAVGDPDIELPGASRGGDPFHVSQLESLLGERAAGQGRLPRARTEATLVASYRGGTPTIDSQATPSRLRAEAPRKRVVHIAAHAVLGAMDNPLTSAILLSREPSPDGHRTDGRLSVGDLITTWGDHLKGCELAVLSCCQTGRGVQVGDSVMALPIGLLHAGVNAIVASLWKVDDLATCLLMTRFHQNLLGDHRTLSGEIDQVDRVAWGTSYARGVPMPVPQALQEAKVWLKALPSMELSEFEAQHPAKPRYVMKDGKYVMKNGKRVEQPTDVQIAQTRDPPFADARYWAAFVVIGDA